MRKSLESKIVQFPFGVIENLFDNVSCEMALNKAPVFIVGPPRSGTTLVYQVLAQGLKVCYFSNFVSIFRKSPILASFLSLPFRSHFLPTNYDSSYGIVKGWNSPSQGVGIWRRWFPLKHEYVEAGEISHSTIREIRNTICWLQRLFNASFLNKWQGLNGLINPINEALPESVFVRVHRNRVQVAQSILLGRKKIHGNENRWISSKPKAYDQIIKESKNNVEQVCKQIYYIEEDLDRDSSAIGNQRFFNISYEEVCDNPALFVNKFRKFYSDINLDNGIEKRECVPVSFQCQNPINVSVGLYAEIQDCLHQLFGDGGK